MSKKKKWWNTGWGGKNTEINESQFSNTIKQHQRKFDEDGIEYLNEDDYGYSSYNWDLDKKLLDKTSSDDRTKEGKQKKYELVKSDYYDSYKSYEKTGVWRGYEKVPQLSYKYVQQMANALAAQHKINVVVGNNWNVDLLKKTLTYNPASLIYGTKSELLATLMHEIGKLRYVTHSSLLKNKYLAMYGLPALEVLSIYEDVRTDFLMLKAYESASEIYESVIPTIESLVKIYMEKGRTFRELIGLVARDLYKNIQHKHRTDPASKFKGLPDPANPAYQAELLTNFGTSDDDKVRQGLTALEEELQNKGSIYEYCGEILSLMYDLDEQHHKKFENIEEKVKLTADTIEPSKKKNGSQELVDYLDTTTYPIVEDLLRDFKDKNEALKNAFPQMNQSSMTNIMQHVKINMEHRGSKIDEYGNVIEEGAGVNTNKQGNTNVRNSGPTDSTVPPEWSNGDYKTLKDSVSMEIKQLVNRLTFLRRDELTVRYEANQKRGKLNMKSLYKSAIGGRRLFKRKLMNTDTIQSFAFSILLDVSGSMVGDRIVHCTRGLIMLAEVFKKMNIPFELTTFSDGSETIKGFEQDMDKTIEKKLGGLPHNFNGGGTNLNRGLDMLKIHSRSERNKVVIVLTDGGIGGAEYYDTKYFIPWEKKGIKSLGFGVECEEEMKRLCQGKSKLLNNASQMPVEFSNLLKAVIKR